MAIAISRGKAYDVPLDDVTMLLNLQRYHRPTSLTEVVALLKKNPDAVAPLAGGTYLVSSGSREIAEVADITHLGLSFIRQDQAGLRIGATTPLQQVIDSEVIKDFAQGVLVQACRATTVSRMRRNVSTVGGEVVVADASSGVPVALLALDARVKVYDGHEREVPLAEFYHDDAQPPLRGAIITEVMLPPSAPSVRAAFLNLAQIVSSLPVVQMAVVVEMNQAVCQMARLAISAATGRPTRLLSAEAVLAGRPLDDQTIKAAADVAAAAISPISDAHGSADYRRDMCRVLTRRALASVANRQ
jgi:carbon-monoxide dehydrogenase medium subunit